MYPTNPYGSNGTITTNLTGPALRILQEKFPNMSGKELNYLFQLMDIPLRTYKISNGFEGERLRILGQKIYDDFKLQGGIWYDPNEGRLALRRIADALVLSCTYGLERRIQLDIIWHEVGDYNSKWNMSIDGYKESKK